MTGRSFHRGSLISKREAAMLDDVTELRTFLTIVRARSGPVASRAGPSPGLPAVDRKSPPNHLWDAGQECAKSDQVPSSQSPAARFG